MTGVFWGGAKYAIYGVFRALWLISWNPPVSLPQQRLRSDHERTSVKILANGLAQMVPIGLHPHRDISLGPRVVIFVTQVSPEALNQNAHHS